MAQEGNITKNIFLGVQQPQSAETALFPERSALGETRMKKVGVSQQLSHVDY